MQMRVTYLPVNYKTETNNTLASEKLFDPKAQLKSHDVDIPLYDQHLNEMGAEDWELISVQPLPNVEYTKKRDITITGGFYFFWQRKPRPKIEETSELLSSKDSFPDVSLANVFNESNESKETLFPHALVNADVSSASIISSPTITSPPTIAQEEVSSQSKKQEPFSSIIANSRIQDKGVHDNNRIQSNIIENDASMSAKDMSAWNNYGTQDHIAKSDVKSTTENPVKSASIWDGDDLQAGTENDASMSAKDMSAWDNYGTQDHVAKSDVKSTTENPANPANPANPVKSASVWDRYDPQVGIEGDVKTSAKDISARERDIADNNGEQDIANGGTATSHDKGAWGDNPNEEAILTEDNMNDSSRPIEYEESFSEPLKHESFTEKLLANNELKNKIDSIKGLLRENIDTTLDITADSDLKKNTQLSAENDFSGFDADLLAGEDITPDDFKQNTDVKNRQASEGDAS